MVGIEKTVKLPYLLVAEASLLPLIGVVVAGLRKYAAPTAIYLVVPNCQVVDFQAVVDDMVVIIPETDILPDWPIDKIQTRLVHADRAGWYLQQFLKLRFGEFSRLEEYVIWDADTVPIAVPQLGNRIETLFCISDEYHRPYFETYRKILNSEPVLSHSVVSQYMRIKTKVAMELQESIVKTTGKICWIDGILSSLSGEDESEFSEYETYANFFLGQPDTNGRTIRVKWFRYGSIVKPDLDNITPSELHRLFSDYSFVAFERHKLRCLRKTVVKLKYFAEKLVNKFKNL